MRLTHITFTGIDEHTDLSRVKCLSERYPYVEFGVLLSYNWKDNGHRFPNPRICEALAELDIGHLSVHLCGQAAIDVAKGDDSLSIALGGGYFYIFSRCQLNLCVRGLFDELRKVLPPLFCREVIVQMNTPELLRQYLSGGSPDKMSFLLDASGGRGIDSPINIVTSPGIHIGYAGGIGPDNVEMKLRKLLEYPSNERFWIDMETRVRTEDDWFDLDKVERVLEICAPIINNINN